MIVVVTVILPRSGIVKRLLVTLISLSRKGEEIVAWQVYCPTSDNLGEENERELELIPSFVTVLLFFIQ